VETNADFRAISNENSEIHDGSKYYGDTMQSACLRLMGKKLLVSLAMERKFSGEGLQILDDGDDMLTAMARELVTERGIGESANAVWQQLRAEQSTLTPPPVTPEPLPSIEEVRPTAPPATLVLNVPVAINALKFGSQPEASHSIPHKKRLNLVPGQDQLALF
jgi:hypothetical protein